MSKKNDDGVTVFYSGVHQAYQIALAAQEIGKLDQFLCSVYSAPKFWGGVFSKIVSSPAMMNRQIEGLDLTRVIENPWPLLVHRVKSTFLPKNSNNWYFENDAFDRWASHKVRNCNSRVVVGTETCASRTFELAKNRGCVTILDCPQVHPSFLIKMFALLSDKLKIAVHPPDELVSMKSKREAEYNTADLFLTYSDIHKQSFIDAGFPNDRIHTFPLWADPLIWLSDGGKKEQSKKLRAIFVGGVSLRKGIPFLIEAVRALQGRVELTLVGAVSQEVLPWLTHLEHYIKLVPPVDRCQLRSLYCQHDLLVLPSLVDSFGFVALEAMACGLPVIISENCGAPVPAQDWRVPIMDSQAIELRFNHYLNNRECLIHDSEVAVHTAKRYTPLRYRDSVSSLLAGCLG